VGAFRQVIEIGDPGGRRFEKMEALVDTGATFTVVPANLLQRLGVAVQRRAKFRLADGTVMERNIGETKIRLDSQEVTTTVVFGEEGEPSLLGVVTLETALLAVDPVRKRLIPVEGLMMQTGYLPVKGVLASPEPLLL